MNETQKNQLAFKKRIKSMLNKDGLRAVSIILKQYVKHNISCKALNLSNKECVEIIKQCKSEYKQTLKPKNN